MKRHPLNGIYNKIMKDIQEAVDQYVQEIMRGFVDPVKLERLTGQPGFDPYMILGLTRDCSDEEIKRRFRDLAKMLHPDTSRCQGTEFLFVLVNLSYEQIAKERRWK